MFRIIIGASLLIAAVAAAQVQIIPPLTQIPPQIVPTVTVTVDPSGAGNFTTITAAVNSVPSGALIKVKTGTYLESGIDFGLKQLVLRSVDGVGAAVIDGSTAGGLASILTLQGNQNGTTVIDGFKFVNARATQGAAIRCLGTSPRIINNVFLDNSAAQGGAIYAENGSPKISGNSFTHNGHGVEPGAVSIDGGAVMLTNCTTEMIGNLFGDNLAGVAGGALFSGTNSVLTMTNNLFDANTTFGNGGAHALVGGSAATVTTNTFSGNSSFMSGGAVWFVNSSATHATTFDSNLFTDNESAVSDGGGMSCETATATFIGNTFEFNRCDHNGGGLNCTGVSSPVLVSNKFRKNAAWNHGGAIACTDNADADIRRCDITDNDIKDEMGTGAGIYVQEASVRIRRNSIIGNGRMTSGMPLITLCYRGGGIDYDGGFASTSQGTIDANQIQKNQVGLNGFGAGVALTNMGPTSTFASNIVAKNSAAPSVWCTAPGVFVESTGPFRFFNNTIAYNSNGVTGGIGGGMVFSNISQQFNVLNSIFWGNSVATGDQNIMSINVPPLAPLPFVDFCDVAPAFYFPTNWVAGTTMYFGVDPQFVDPTRDYHLQNTLTQLFKDAGTNSIVNMTTPPTDIDVDGLPRIANFSGGGLVDIGADEL